MWVTQCIHTCLGNLSTKLCIFKLPSSKGNSFHKVIQKTSNQLPGSSITVINWTNNKFFPWVFFSKTLCVVLNNILNIVQNKYSQFYSSNSLTNLHYKLTEPQEIAQCRKKAQYVSNRVFTGCSFLCVFLYFNASPVLSVCFFKNKTAMCIWGRRAYRWPRGEGRL